MSILSNIKNNERLYLLGYTINYIEKIMIGKNGKINLSTPINFVFLFSGSANSEIAIIEELLRLYPTIKIKNIYLISNYNKVVNNQNIAYAKFLTLLPNINKNIHTLTFENFNKLLLENCLFKKSEKVICFSINSQTNSSVISPETSGFIIFMRSRKSLRCGEVYSPTLYPASCKAEASR